MKSGKFSPLLVALLLGLAGALSGLAYVILTDTSAMVNNNGLWFAVGGIVLVALIGLVMIRDTRKQLAEQASQNERNQAAILQLLDEIADLAEGDLTIHASVTENFTGAIADSINFAIDQMRGLVSKINHLSVQVASAASATETTAGNLSKAAENQAKEIGAATRAINEMAVSIDHVSSNAAESAAVAERAVDIANNGHGHDPQSDPGNVQAHQAPR
jgi:twitching motility protein PilJ